MDVNGPTRCPESLRSLNSGVRPVYGVFRAVRDARCADATPHLYCLSRFWRVCAIRGAFSRNPRGDGPRKDGTREPGVSAVLRVYKPKRYYHVTSIDDKYHIQFRENEFRRTPRGNVSGRPVSGRDSVGRRERTCTVW
jgi:hypothetical protein